MLAAEVHMDFQNNPTTDKNNLGYFQISSGKKRNSERYFISSFGSKSLLK